METKKMKKVGIGTVVLTIVVFLVAMWLVSQAFGLMNLPSNLGVVGGLALLILVGVACWFYGTKVLLPRCRGNISAAKIVVVLAVLSSALTSGCTRIGPGHVGIEVDMAGSQRGVQDFALKTGWVFYNPVGTSVMEYPTFVQTAKWTKNLNEGNQ